MLESRVQYVVFNFALLYGGEKQQFNPYQCYSECVFLSCCNMYDVYLFDMLFTKFLLTQILEILIVNKLL